MQTVPRPHLTERIALKTDFCKAFSLWKVCVFRAFLFRRTDKFDTLNYTNKEQQILKIEQHKINCHVRDKENNIKYFCSIIYEQGSPFILTTNTKEDIAIKDNSFICFDGENNRYILNNLLFKDNYNPFYGNRYQFESLITEANFKSLCNPKSYEEKNIKFKSVYFTFPLINLFFFNIDCISTDNFSTDRHFLEYQKNCEFKTITIDGYTMELCSGFRYGGGKIGGDEAHFTLIKSIKISSKEEHELKDFIKIINSLINFFSICLRKKILISKIWSNKIDNTLNIDTEIKTFQFYILNTDYENVPPFKCLATYALLKDNFEEIVNKFYKAKQGPYEAFPVFCDLYMRYNDAPYEVLPQMRFLPLMQGIEAYIGHFDYNQPITVPSSSKKALKKFKEENSDLPLIDTIDFPNFIPFQEKIFNTINELNIEKIIKFKLYKNKTYKLINQMVKIRNYYTHYGKLHKIDTEDFFDAMDYTKIICEILIMKELNFTEHQIKLSLNNNYFFLKKWNNKYCSLVEEHHHPKGLENCIYVGEIDTFKKNKYKKFSLYYKKEESNNTVILYAKNMMKYGKLQKKAINLPASDRELSSLNDIFKRCYDNYIESEIQLSYRKDLLNKIKSHKNSS